MAEEAARSSEGGGLTINIVSLLIELAGVLSKDTGGAGAGGDQKFWTDSLSHLLTNAVDLCQLARLPLTLSVLRELINSAPQSLDQASAEAWRSTSACYRAIVTAAGLAEHGDASLRTNVEECATFFLTEWAGLSFKTRSTIVLMAAMLMRPFVTRPLHRIFSTDTNVRPEDAFDGKLILVNLPAQTYKTVGVFAGIVWKYCTQLAIMRRPQPTDGSYLRPVFIFSDEAQNFISEFDYVYQAVARSAAGVTCYVVQNRESLIAKVGDEYKVDSLLANLQTKIFCQNTGGTNVWASELVGERYVRITGASINRNGQEVTSSAGVNINEERRPFLESARLASLKRGGPANDFQVEAVLFKGGHVFADGLPYQLVTFDQR